MKNFDKNEFSWHGQKNQISQKNVNRLLDFENLVNLDSVKNGVSDFLCKWNPKLSICKTSIF